MLSRLWRWLIGSTPAVLPAPHKQCERTHFKHVQEAQWQRHR